MNQSLKTAVERVGDFVSVDLILPNVVQGTDCEENQTFLMLVIDLSSLEVQVFIDSLCLQAGREARSKLRFRRIWGAPSKEIESKN